MRAKSVSASIRRIEWISGVLPMRETDSRLIALLKANARQPVASLSRKLDLARSTMQERAARLEREGIIKGYTPPFCRKTPRRAW